MTNSTKILGSLFLFLLISSVIVGIMTKNSFVDDVNLQINKEKYDTYGVSINGDSAYNEIYFEKINDFTELQHKSNVILRVTPTEERSNLAQSVLSKVKVIEVYKGKDIKKGEFVYIHEPNQFANEVYMSTNGYNLMTEGNEYIVFLKHLTIPENYTYKGQEEKTFVFVSSQFGKYSLNLKQNMLINREKAVDLSIPYNEIKEQDILTTDSLVLEKYNIMRENVYKAFKIQVSP